MCGRFTQTLTWAEIHALYALGAAAVAVNLEPRFNGCPTQSFAVCRLDEARRRHIAKLRWGLVPSWAKDPRIASRLINARAETVHTKPAYRSAFRRRRALVPAQGWFEWQTTPAGKQPHFIAPAKGAALSFAALWERRHDQGEALETFTLITTAAAPALAALHPRQPAVLAPEHFAAWLDPDTPRERLLALVRTPHTGPFEVRAVSPAVNNPRNDHPGVLVPWAHDEHKPNRS